MKWLPMFRRPIAELTPRTKELEREADTLSHSLSKEMASLRRAKVQLRTALIDEMTRRPSR